MAEQVQKTMDEMVAPLADLMDRNIFSQSEIHAIVSRRRESEYLTRRVVPRKADFLRYIQDEMQLEQLRQLRYKKQQALERERMAKLGRLDEYTKQQANKKNNLGDPHIVQHIHLLFRRALRKYNKEDVSVYLQYADACKQLRSFNKLPQVYAEAVQMHPHATGLWIEAASHEFFQRQSVSSARVLLQRALRINKTSKDLWWQSFALEFHYLAKMQGRRTILQNPNGNNSAPGTESGKTNESLESNNLYAVAKIVYDNAIDAIPDDVSFRLGFLDLCRTFPQTESMEDYIIKTVRNDFSNTPKAWIARATYLLEQQQAQNKENGNYGKNAPKGFTVKPEEPLDSEAKAEESSNDQSDSAESSSENSNDDVGKDARETSNERPRKRRRRSGDRAALALIQQDPVLAIIYEALKVVCTSDMFVESARFMWSYWEQAEDVFEDSETVEQTKQRILMFLGHLFQQASNDSDVYGQELVLEHAEYFVRIGEVEQSLQVLSNFVQTATDESTSSNLTSVWLRLAGLTLHMASPQEARKILATALKSTTINKPDHCKILLELFGVELVIAREKIEDDKVKQLCENIARTFEKLLLLASSSSSDFSSDESEGQNRTLTSISQACFQAMMFFVDSLGEVKGVRKACAMVLFKSNLLHSLDARNMEDVEALVAFFDKCLEVELSKLKRDKPGSNASTRKKDKFLVRQVLEEAIRFFEGVPSLAGKYRQLRHELSII